MRCTLLLPTVWIGCVAFGCSSGTATTDLDAGEDIRADSSNADDSSVDSIDPPDGSADTAAEVSVDTSIAADSAVDDTPLDTLMSDVGTADSSSDSAVETGVLLTPGDPGPSDVKFVIRTDTSVHPISALIYGTNGTRDVASNRQTVARLGGNRLTAWNWENNASNAGSDWCFQNDDMFPSNTPGEAVREMLTTMSGSAAVVTVPIVDFVAADKKGGGGPPDCPNDVRKSADYLNTRFKKNKPIKGSAFSLTPNTGDDSVYQDEFVAWVKGKFPSTKVVFSLDNEPDLWADTHAEIHPAKVGYDELCKRNIDFAKAIKATWPEAEVAGFVSYGFTGYVSLQDAPDKAGKGEFIDYWLGKMKAADTGKRLVDYLDLHYYSEARGGGRRIADVQGDDGTAAARVQATRSLFDATYREDSWISNDYLRGPVNLIPWLKAKVVKGYANTKLSFTEWNFGGGGHISGAIAVADALGIFGRESVGLATYWELFKDESFAYAGLRVFRNYDGKAGTFGDTSISAISSNEATASVYASIASTDPSRVVVVAINRSITAKKAGITIADGKTFRKAKVFVLTQAGGAKLVPGPDVTAVATNAFSYSMPGYSVTVLVPE